MISARRREAGARGPKAAQPQAAATTWFTATSADLTRVVNEFDVIEASVSLQDRPSRLANDEA
jgi:hypothetical protein